MEYIFLLRKYIRLIITAIFILLLTEEVYSKQIKIAILDTGLNPQQINNIKLCKLGHKDFTNTSLKDNNGHGTHIANIIADRLVNIDYCLIIIKVFDRKDSSVEKTIRALNYLTSLKNIDIINYSAGGELFDIDEAKAVQKLLNLKYKIVAAAGNEHKNLDINCNYFPACYDRKILTVGSLNKDGLVSMFSNYGKFVKIWEKGEDIVAAGVSLSGTSQATAIATSNLAIFLYKKGQNNVQKERTISK